MSSACRLKYPFCCFVSYFCFLFFFLFQLQNIDPWPSRQSRNKCIRLEISGYNLDLWTGWIRCNCDAHRKQVSVKQLYNRVPQTAWVSWSQLQLEFESQFEAVGTRSRQRAWGSQWPPVEQASRMRKKCCYSQRNLGSIYCSLFRLQLTFHTQPFRNPFENKVWEVYFSKEVCSFVIIVDYVSAYICIRIVISRLYNTMLPVLLLTAVISLFYSF